MKLLKKIANWIRPSQNMEYDNRAFEWCIVGNIVDRHFYGVEKEIRQRTKQFRLVAKVYCMPEFGGMAHEEIRVLGNPKKQKRLINIVMKTKRIKNFRVQKVYNPKIQSEIGSHIYYWQNGRSKDEVKNLEKQPLTSIH